MTEDPRPGPTRVTRVTGMAGDYPLCCRIIMEREAIEFHDSLLARIEHAGGRIRLLFEPAYVHRSSGDPARDVGTGWSANTQLTIFGSNGCLLPLNLPCGVWGGHLRLGEQE